MSVVKFVCVGSVMFLLGAMSQLKHFLNVLLVMEAFSLMLVMGSVFFFFQVTSGFMMFFLLVLSVSEASVGLGLLVVIMRTGSADKVISG